VSKWIVASIVGIVSISFSPVLPSIPWLLIFLVIFLLSLKYKRIYLLGGVSFGVIFASVSGHVSLSSTLLSKLESTDILIRGVVVGLPEQKTRYQRFNLSILEARSVSEPELTIGLNQIRINWYEQRPDIAPGQEWQLLVRLKRPHGFSNPGGFDYETWLFRQGIDATGYVRAHSLNQLLGNHPYIGRVDKARQQLNAALDRVTGELAHSQLLKTLVMGTGANIDQQQWELFAATGTSHLFVISGLHVGFVGTLAYIIFYFLSRWTLVGPFMYSAQQTAAVCTVLSIGCYCLLAGFSLPTQRAFVMGAILMLGIVAKRPGNLWRRYFLAMLLVLMLDPLAAQGSGFWLSFGAVGSLLFAYASWSGQQGIWWHWLRPQWICFVALAPPLLYVFGQISVIFPFANLVGVPLVGFVIAPLCLLAGLSLSINETAAFYGFLAADTLLDWLLHYLRWLGGIPGMDYAGSPQLTATVLASIGVFIILLPQGLPQRWLGGVCFLPLFISVETGISPGGYQLSVLDVGQGLAAVIETQNHTLVYDVGAVYSDHFNAADAVILPYLGSRSLTRLDRVLVSHGDHDHAGALSQLIEGVLIDHLVLPADIEAPEGIPVSRCENGVSWSWDGVTFEMMQMEGAKLAERNNASCILRVTNGTVTTLLTGDIEAKAEHKLTQLYADRLPADILIVPHHGSKTSSSPEFLNAVHASHAIVSAGYRNRFNHPHPEIVERLRRHKIMVWNTANEGMIQLRVTKLSPEFSLFGYRATFRRYWL